MVSPDWQQASELGGIGNIGNRRGTDQQHNGRPKVEGGAVAADIISLNLAVNSDDVTTANQRLDQMPAAAGRAEGATTLLSSSFNNLKKYIEAAAAALALMKLAEYAKDTLLLAARYETLGVVINVIGKTAGYTATQMSEFQKGLQKTGISAIEARAGLALMGQANIDFVNSSKLARIAQDAAVIGNINSSEAFNRMMTGLATGQSIILHHLGLMTNFEQAYLDAAHAMGKTTNDLTEVEKGMIRANETIRAGAGIAGSYEAAMGTVGKQLTSMPRYIQDFMVQIGGMGQGVLLDGVTAMANSLKWLSKNFEGVSSAIKTIATAGALAVFGSLAAKVTDYANSLALSSIHSQALIMNTVRSAEITAIATAAKATETAEIMHNNLSRLAAVNVMETEARATFWGTTVLQERILAENILIACEARRSVITGELALSVNAATTAEIRATEAAVALSAAQTGVTVTAGLAAGAMGVLRTAMNFLGGPIGVIATAIGAITYGLVKISESTGSASQKLTEFANNLPYEKMKKGMIEQIDLIALMEKTSTLTTPQLKADETRAQNQKDISLALKENITLGQKQKELMSQMAGPFGGSRTGGTIWGNPTELDLVNARIRVNNELISDGARRTEQKIALDAKQAKLQEDIKKRSEKPASAPETEYRDVTDQTYSKYTNAFDSMAKQIRANNPNIDELTRKLEEVDAGVLHNATGVKEYDESLKRQGESVKRSIIVHKEYADAIKDVNVYSQFQGDSSTIEYAESLIKSLTENAPLEKFNEDMSTLIDYLSSAPEFANKTREAMASLQAVFIASSGKTAMGNDITALQNGLIGDPIAKQQAILDQQYGVKKAALDNELKMAESYAGKHADITKKLDLLKQTHDKDTTDNANKGMKSNLAMLGNYASIGSDLFAGMAAAQDQSSRAGFESAKNYNLGAALMSTAAAVIGQLSGADSWTPVAWARAAAAGILGAMQVVKIASTSFGGGGSADSSVPSGSFGVGGSAGSVGGSIGPQINSVRDSQTQDQLQRIADNMENASLAIGKVSDGLTKIADLFREGGFMSLATGSAPGMGIGVKQAYGGALGSGSSMRDLLGFGDSAGKGAAFGAALGPVGAIIGGMIGSAIGIFSAAFGHGAKQIESAGVTLGLTAGNLISGTFQNWKEKGGWFASDRTGTMNSAGDPAFTAVVQSALDKITGTIIRGAVATGTSANFAGVNIGGANIATAGRKSEDIQKDLEAWFTNASNTLAKTVDGLQAFAFYGENAFDALVRLSTALQSTNEGLELIGAGLIRSSLYGANAAFKLQDMMGGAEEFTSKVDNYFSKMFTDAEQDAMKTTQAQRQVKTAFAEMNREVPKTKAEFTALVNILDLTTERGSQLFAGLMDITDAFAQTQKAVDATTDALKESAQSALDVAMKAANTLKEIMGGTLSQGSPESLYRGAQATVAAAMANGRNAELPDLIKTALTASRAYNASGPGYAADYEKYTKVLADIAGMTGVPTRTAAERQVQLLIDINAALDKNNLEQLQAFTVQIDSTNALNTALKAYLAATNPAVTPSPAPVGLTNAEAARMVLKMAVGTLVVDMKWDLDKSGVVNSSDAFLALGGTRPSYATGSAYIPYDQTANLHQGEMVIDRASSDALRKYGVPASGSADNKESVAELKEQNRLLRELLTEAKAGVRVQQAVGSKLIEQGEESNSNGRSLTSKLNLAKAP